MAWSNGHAVVYWPKITWNRPTVTDISKCKHQQKTKNKKKLVVIHGATSLSFRWHTFFFLSSLKHPFQESYPFWSRTTYTAKVITEQHCVPTFYSSRRICCTRPQRRKRGDTKRNVWCSVLTPTLWTWNVQVCLFTSVTPQLQDSI